MQRMRQERKTAQETLTSLHYKAEQSRVEKNTLDSYSLIFYAQSYSTSLTSSRSHPYVSHSDDCDNSKVSLSCRYNAEFLSKPK